MTTKSEVYEDLKVKVEELFDAAKKDATEKLDTLQRSGAGVLDDHEKNGMSYQTPKDFMVAYSFEIARSYQPASDSNKHKRLIDNYRAMM